jgi:hypothetical protein
MVIPLRAHRRALERILAFFQRRKRTRAATGVLTGDWEEARAAGREKAGAESVRIDGT